MELLLLFRAVKDRCQPVAQAHRIDVAVFRPAGSAGLGDGGARGCRDGAGVSKLSEQLEDRVAGGLWPGGHF